MNSQEEQTKGSCGLQSALGCFLVKAEVLLILVLHLILQGGSEEALTAWGGLPSSQDAPATHCHPTLEDNCPYMGSGLSWKALLFI